MRDLLSKMMTGTMIAGAALLVSRLRRHRDGDTADNTLVTDMNATDPMMDGTTTDNMTAVDGAMAQRRHDGERRDDGERRCRTRADNANDQREVIAFVD